MHDIPAQARDVSWELETRDGAFEVVYCLSGTMNISATCRECGEQQLSSTLSAESTSFLFLRNSDIRLSLAAGEAFQAVSFRFSLDFLMTTDYKDGCLCGAILDKSVEKPPTAKDPLWFYVNEQTPLPLKIAIQELLWPAPGTILGNMFQAYKSSELLYMQARLLETASHALQRCAAYEGTAVRKANDILMTNLASPPGLAELAERVGLTKSRLNNLFRSLYGDTVFGTVRKERLQCARRMLSGGGWNVTQVAHECGFSSTSHLTKSFSEHFGITPKQYQNACLQSRDMVPAMRG